VATTIKVAPGYDPNNTLVFTSGGQLVTDRFGMSSARAVWWYNGPSPETQVSVFSQHPRWSFLEMDKRTITLREDGAWDITGDYFGVQGTPEAIYAMDVSTGQEPIETHPDFETFAGKYGSEVNGAKFDPEDQTFINFVANGIPATNRKWVGVRAYLNASAVWRETVVRKSRPTIDELQNIGKIDSPNGSPATPSGRNWLYGSISFEQKAKTYTIRREWLLSGPDGWNDVLYAP
jgi:hypothetical protein